MDGTRRTNVQHTTVVRNTLMIFIIIIIIIIVIIIIITIITIIIIIIIIIIFPLSWQNNSTQRSLI
jgi:hypothetical protein